MDFSICLKKEEDFRGKKEKEREKGLKPYAMNP